MPTRRSVLRPLVLSAGIAAVVVLGVTWTPPEAPPDVPALPADGVSTPAPPPGPPARATGQDDSGEPPLLSWWQIDGESLADAGNRLRLGALEFTAVSDDGAVLASISYPGEDERRVLRFVDIATWTLRAQAEVRGHVGQSRLTPVDGAGLVTFAGEELVWVGSSATQVGDVNAHDFAVYRASAASPEPQTVLELPADTLPWAMAPLDGDRLAVAATSWGRDHGQPGSPTVLLADLAAGEIRWTLELDGVEDGFRPADEEFPEHISPGAAWDTDRERLYVVHAHDDGVTVVDLAAGSSTRHDLAQRPSLTGWLAGWFAPSAHAKVSHGTSRTAALSPDGATLAISGVRTELVRDLLGNVSGERMRGLGVRLVDTATLVETARLDLAVSDVGFAPDGRLLATGVGDGRVVAETTQHSGLYVVDAGTGEVVAHRYDGAIPWVRGFDAEGTRAYVSVGDRLEVVDTATWTTVAMRPGGALGLPHLGLLAAWPDEPRGSSARGAPPAQWPSTPAFEEPTGTVLLFDDGYDGVLAVDLDGRVATRRALEGQRAGDQPHRLVRAGDHLLVGWGSVHAVSIADASSRLLGDATIFVPGGEDGAWLVDYPGGRIGQGAPTYRRVDLEGAVVEEAAGVPPGFAAGGTGDGLVLEGDDAVLVWHGDGQVSELGGPGFVADTGPGTVVWCEGGCDALRVWRPGATAVTIEVPRSGQAFDARSARLSPDGRWVSAIVAQPDPGGAAERHGTVVVASTTGGEATAVTRPLSPTPAYLGWSRDGAELYFSTDSYGGSETLAGRYRPADGDVRLAALPFGGALSFVVLDRDEAGAFLAAEPAGRQRCGPPHGRPGGRGAPCSFDY